MTLALFADKDTHRKTLEKAFSVLEIDVQTYNSLADISESEGSDIGFFIVSKSTLSEAVKKAQNMTCFAIFDSSIDLKEDQKTEFFSVFERPVRLGRVVQSVKLYLHQKEQRDSLKPIKMGRFILDPKASHLQHGDKKSFIKLTEKEQEMLLYLYSQKGTPVSRQTLLDNVWGYADGVETHTLETHIYRLRRKIENDPAAPQFLMTDEKGYYLNL